MRDCQSGGEGGEREREVGDSRKFCNSPAEQVKCATCFHFRSLLSLPQLSLLPCITNWMEGGGAGRRGRHATKRRRFGGSCVTRSIATPPLGTAASASNIGGRTRPTEPAFLHGFALLEKKE